MFVVSVVYGVCCSNGWLCVALSIGSITLSHGFLRIYIYLHSIICLLRLTTLLLYPCVNYDGLNMCARSVTIAHAQCSCTVSLRFAICVSS